MKKISKKMIAIFTAVTLLVGGVGQNFVAKAADVSNVGALLDEFTAGSGTFTLATSSRIFVVSESEPTGDLLQTAQLIQREFQSEFETVNSNLGFVWGEESWAWTGDVVLKLDTASDDIGAEGYELNVSDTATITATDVDGLIYGANTLLKCFRAVRGNSLSGFTAADAPDTKERTVMLDVGRKYYTKEWICNFIRQLSWMGYNTLELHFSEDGGFRADFWDEDYYTDNYSPENDFTWLCGSHVQSWVKDPYRTDPDAGKYLTTAELVEIIDVAKEYHIDIIPSFDSPAHMDYITWKFEQNYKSNKSYSFTYNGTTYKASSTSGCINYTGKTGASTPTWPYYTTIDITDGTMAKAFIFALYEDIADFFKEYAGSTDFSIGADEVNLSSGYGIKWSYSQFPGYVNELNRMLNAKGYTCRMFNDFIGSTTYNQSNSKAVYDFDDNIEIMYWNSDFNPTTGEWDEDIWHVKFFWENNTGSTDNWGDGGRTLYNCIQTNCYYVLRVAASSTSYPNMDARNPENYNWTFYHSTEEEIYNEWYPADISEKGLYTENAADVPEDQLGGAYFLIWNDYASLNTEAEVWNGVKDNTGTSSYTYSLFDRMWSNTIKMWNSDVNSTVTYKTFTTVRDTFDYFPGFTSCSADAYFPVSTAITQAYLADHTKLTAELANKIDGTVEQGDYTDESYTAYVNAYNAYLEAYEAAENVNASYRATEDEVNNALCALQTATNNFAKAAEALTTDSSSENEEETNLKIQLKTTVNGEVYILKTLGVNVDSAFSVYIKPMTGYTFESIEGATYNPLPSNDGSGYVVGKMSGKTMTITVWYENTPDTSRLEYLIRNAITDLTGYTEKSLEEYEASLESAKNFVLTEDKTQSDIDELVTALMEAQTNLVKTASETSIISIEKLTETARLGKQVALKITTTADIADLTITDTTDEENVVEETLNLCVGKVQTLTIGEVKIWLVYFDADETGDFEYTITATTEKLEQAVTDTITITVQ